MAGTRSAQSNHSSLALAMKREWNKMAVKKCREKAKLRFQEMQIRVTELSKVNQQLHTKYMLLLKERNARIKILQNAGVSLPAFDFPPGKARTPTQRFPSTMESRCYFENSSKCLSSNIQHSNTFVEFPRPTFGMTSQRPDKPCKASFGFSEFGTPRPKCEDLSVAYDHRNGETHI